MVVTLERTADTVEPALTPPPRRLRIHLDRVRRFARTHGISAVTALAFVAVAVYVMGPLWADPGGRTFPSNLTDQSQFEWFLLHGLHVFTRGENPLTITTLNVPLGVNLMANTPILALSLPLAPLTAWLGPSTVYVLLLTLGLAGTAYAWYHVIFRHFVHDRAAAIIGGAICGFGPGIVAHTNGHPNITAQFLIPFILWRALALRNHPKPWRNRLILTGLIIVQVFINEELLLDTAIAGVIFLTVYALARPRETRDAIGKMLVGTATVAAIGAILLAYPMWFQFTGAGHVNGLPLAQQEFPYRLPLISFVTLPSMSWWGDPARNLTLAVPPEENSFLGWAVVLVTLGIVVALWRRSPAVRALFVVGVLFGYASLGNQVSISDPERSYPYSLWSHLSSLPPFNNILPTRLALVVLPVVGLLCAIAIAHARRALARRRPPREVRVTAGRLNTQALVVRRELRVRWRADAAAIARRRQRHHTRVRVTATAGLVAIGAALVTIVPAPVSTVARQPVPRFFLDGTWRDYVPPGYSVLAAAPIDRMYPENMHWAVATGLGFSVPAGYFLGPDLTGRARFGPTPEPTMTLLNSAGRGVVRTSITARQVQQGIRDVRYWRTAIVVLEDGRPYEGNLLVTLDALYGPGIYVDDVWLWDVRKFNDGVRLPYTGSGWKPTRPATTIR
jgi:hypothetical protein